jgi:hypothetical protein
MIPGITGRHIEARRGSDNYGDWANKMGGKYDMAQRELNRGENISENKVSEKISNKNAEMDKGGKENYGKAVSSVEKERKITKMNKDKAQHKQNKERGKYEQNKGGYRCIREPR